MVVQNFLPDCMFFSGRNADAFCVKMMTIRFLGGIDLFFLLTVVPGVIFMCFLLAKLKLSITILKSTESLVLLTMYTFVWLVCVFNLLFAALTIVVATTTYASNDPSTNTTMSGHYNMSNISYQNETHHSAFERFISFIGPNNVPSIELDVFSRLCQAMLSFIIEFIELSVIVFMMHFGTTLSNSTVLIRTSLISGLISFVDNALSTAITFLFQFPHHRSTQLDATSTMFSIAIRESALYDALSSATFCFLYTIILLLPFTRYRNRLPERKTFYFYILFLMFNNILQVIGNVMILCCVSAGICFVSLSKLIYFAFYAPMLYSCFLGPVLKRSFYDQYTLELYYSQTATDT